MPGFVNQPTQQNVPQYMANNIYANPIPSPLPPPSTPGKCPKW